MWRLLLAVGLLLTAVVSDSQGGYWVVRVLIGGGAGGAAPAGPAGPGPAGPGGRIPRAGGEAARPVGPPAGPMPMPAPGAGGMGVDHAPGDPANSIVVVVPFVKPQNPKQTNPGPRDFYAKDLKPQGSWNVVWKLGLKHDFGYTNFIEAAPIERYGAFSDKPAPGETYEAMAREKHAKYENLKKYKKAADPNLLYEAVTAGLDHGLPGEAYEWANQLLAVSKTPDGDGLSENAKRFLKAFAVVQPKLDTPGKKTQEALVWQTRLSLLAAGAKMHANGHYTLIYWGDRVEADRRLKQLNDNFNAFFMWHCNRGVVLDVPDRSMTTVLLPGEDKLREVARPIMDVPMEAIAKGTPRGGELARAPDGWHLVDLGFYAPDRDLLVISPHRGDSVATTFRVQNKANVYNDTPRELLLKGGGPSLPEPPDKSTNAAINENPAAYDVARNQTLAMVERFMQHEAEVAGVSREASRQLFYETGMLPRHVILPQWLQTGSAHFFNRPVGPVFTTAEDGTTTMTVALTTGYGRPNFVMQKHFRDMPMRKELTNDPEKLLRNVLTDAYFGALTDGDELDAPPEAARKPVVAAAPAGPPGPGAAGVAAAAPEEDEAADRRHKEERMALKAQATAWALFYYLYREKPAEFKKYADELAKLPRDLPLDEKTAVEVFSRAFNLSTPEEFKTFAEAWKNAVTGTAPAGVDIPIRKPDPTPPMPTPGTPPGPRQGNQRG
jgi:hypothetical protein